MGRFHFDENVIGGVVSSMESITQNISDAVAPMKDAVIGLRNHKGFDIDFAKNMLDEEVNNMPIVLEKLRSGYGALCYIKERTALYSETSRFQDNRVVKYVNNSTNKLGRFNTPFFQYDDGGITEKYFCKNNDRFIISQIWDAFTDTIFHGGYEKKIIYDTLRSMIDGQVIENSIPNHLTDIFNKYLVDYADGVGGLLKDLEGVAGLSDVMKYVKEAKFSLQMVKNIASDYTVNLQLLDSLESSLRSTGLSSDVLNDVMSSLRSDYEHKYIYTLKQMVEKAGTTFVEALVTTNPVGAAVIGIKDYIDNSYKATCVSVTTDSQKDFLSITTYANNVAIAWENLGQNIANGNYTQQDLTDFENMFYMARQLQINKYEAALGFVENVDEKAHCQEAIAYYQSLSI